MAGKISDAEKNLKINNKVNSSMVKISSSKSILSYQNGSVLNIESREVSVDEGIPGNGYPEELTMPQEPFSEDQNSKSECLDLLRKKLISDLSLTVFSPDLENKLAKMEPTEISKERQLVIQKILVQISQLSDAEKLLLYLKLPSSTSSPFDPLRQPLNPLGNRHEIQQTIVWIKTHLEEDSEISIPKQEVYDQYLKYCENVSMKPLSTADFGKVMKQVYPGVRPRRLGTRGNSSNFNNFIQTTSQLLKMPMDGKIGETSNFKIRRPQRTRRNNPRNSDDNSSSECRESFISRLIDFLLGPSLSQETNKCKKFDRSKRKLKSTACRSEKCTIFNEPCSDLNTKAKNIKRLKIEYKESEIKDSKEEAKEQKTQENVEEIKTEVDLCEIKCKESSDNSLNTLELECGLDSDFGIYFKSEEKAAEDSPTRSSLVCDSSSGMEAEDKQNDFEKMLFNSDSSQILTVDRNNKSYSEGNLFSLVSCGQSENAGNAFSCHIKSKANGLDGPKNSKSDQRKPSKGRARRSAFFSKPVKNLRKCYVPIQPKPVDMNKFNVRFEQPVGINQFLSDQKIKSEGLSLCEESDSQEPEEEIVRYFKHLDENEINTDNAVDQAVKNIDNTAVQNSNLPQIIKKNSTSYLKGDDVLNPSNQHVLRSQSCFEVQRRLFNVSENTESDTVPRSQSSVELPMSIESVRRESIDSDSVANGKTKKISHLRILLEKSISTGNKIPYSSLRESSNAISSENPVISTVQVSDSMSQVPPNEPNNLLSPAKIIERDLLKLNGLKILNSGPSYVPQSPNNRTKYFSFTPISPGPQSPLKTPSTPSASPFVSPRNTPVPRSRQNSSNDFFLSPSEKKSISFRLDSKKNEFVSDNDFNFSKTLAGNPRTERSKQYTYLQGCRPRSFSSTNFCRSKARRNSSKLVGFSHSINSVPDWAQAATQNNFLINAQFSIHKNFVSSESLSNEVRKLLENNSAMSDDRSSTIRSQSVPLNRMISESTWMPTQVSSVYSSYFNSESSNPTLAPASGKFSDWTSNSGTSSPKDITANVSPFLPNGEMTNLESGPANNEVFSEDPTIVQLDEYFTENFRPGNDESFHEESAFSNKLDLNSAGTFDSPFASESDPAIADSIKSYLPDFEGLENKNLENEDGILNDAKLLRIPLYERENENLKDPVITSFKPVITNEMSSCPGSPVLSFFGNKMSEDNQQLIEFFNFED